MQYFVSINISNMLRRNSFAKKYMLIPILLLTVYILEYAKFMGLRSQR